MEFYIDFGKFSISIRILEYAYERKTYEYISVHIRAFKYLRLDLFRDEKYGFMFHIDLPFIHVNNTVYQRVSRGTDPAYHVEPVVTGKILWWEIKFCGQTQERR